MAVDPPNNFPYPCTAAYGKDGYGIWQTVIVKGVAQTFRWIPAGTFTMGSPPDEPGRNEDELQREITLTRGFWLGDTACSEALWAALVGEASDAAALSHRPVEPVSFEDVGRFLDLWRQACPEFPMRLPREAEWEYACRAGTTMPFWCGEQISPDRVNYAAEDPSSLSVQVAPARGKTLNVKAFTPNPWGLYQMHGNVWECCYDWFGAYDAQDTCDPQGLQSGRSRVIRGGGYADDARRCRAAYRLASPPGIAWRAQGFRLAGDG